MQSQEQQYLGVETVQRHKKKQETERERGTVDTPKAGAFQFKSWQITMVDRPPDRTTLTPPTSRAGPGQSDARSCFSHFHLESQSA